MDTRSVGAVVTLLSLDEVRVFLREGLPIERLTMAFDHEFVRGHGRNLLLDAVGVRWTSGRLHLCEPKFFAKWLRARKQPERYTYFLAHLELAQAELALEHL
jgi:hypothetical protein